jgi:hypothetical protein
MAGTAVARLAGRLLQRHGRWQVLIVCSSAVADQAKVDVGICSVVENVTRSKHGAKAGCKPSKNSARPDSIVGQHAEQHAKAISAQLTA